MILGRVINARTPEPFMFFLFMEVVARELLSKMRGLWAVPLDRSQFFFQPQSLFPFQKSKQGLAKGLEDSSIPQGPVPQLRETKYCHSRIQAQSQPYSSTVVNMRLSVTCSL